MSDQIFLSEWKRVLPSPPNLKIWAKKSIVSWPSYEKTWIGAAMAFHKYSLQDIKVIAGIKDNHHDRTFRLWRKLVSQDQIVRSGTGKRPYLDKKVEEKIVQFVDGGKQANTPEAVDDFIEVEVIKSLEEQGKDNTEVSQSFIYKLSNASGVCRFLP